MTRTLTFLSLILTTAACTPQGDDFSGVLPDERLLIDLPNDFGGQARSNLGDSSEYLALTSDVTGDINGLIGDVLEGIGTITEFDPTWSDGNSKALWGPWEDGGTNGRLWVEQTADGGYNWAIDAKLVDEGEDAYTAVFGGQIDPGADEIASVGRFAIDFGQITRLNPTEAITGEFYVEYAIDGDAVDAQAGFSGFSEDGGPYADAGYAYSQDGTGAGAMDLAISVDEYGGPDPELHVVRSRWNPAGEGRADVYLTEGDLGPLVYTATECWDANAQVSFYEDNYEFTRNGEESACAFAEPEYSEADTAPVR